MDSCVYEGSGFVMDHNIECKRIIITAKFFVNRHDGDEEEDDWQMHILSYHFQSWLCGPFWFAYEQWLPILHNEIKYHFSSILWYIFWTIIKIHISFVIFCHSQSILDVITLLCIPKVMLLQVLLSIRHYI